MRSVSVKADAAKQLVNTANTAYGEYQNKREKANNSFGNAISGVGSAVAGVSGGALMLPEPSGATKVAGLVGLATGGLMNVIGDSMSRKAESRANQALVAANEANASAVNEINSLEQKNSASQVNNSGGMQYSRGVQQSYANTDKLREQLKPLPMN